MMRPRYLRFAALLLTFGLLGLSRSVAAPVTFYFWGGITSVEAGACWPGSCDQLEPLGPGLAAIGTRFSGQYTFDTAWSPTSSSESPPSNSTVAFYRAAPDSTTTIINLGGVTFSF